MKKRLLCLGLLAAVSQVFATGCHPVARWRANHPRGLCDPCGPCVGCLPRLHPIQSRRVVLGEPIGPVVDHVATGQPCQECSGGLPAPTVTVGIAPGDVVPVTHPPAGYPSIGYPTPIIPGPTVVPQYALPNPMPVPKANGEK